ncbi:hypothetical protein Back11_13220 [Paenibacillus baekrokdamisoli]|uniref:DUF3898 domain-containing protein n=1 Tax=Paenibacillus baekrokdamisoli TaxID=1712516 RepID=A0A3G9IM03_9BACL|nr:DUF3900 domain-containing protein [Paenibacillus baekrokdamisoli]MBB3070626.1 hypothetical protein [Paenibacillus baekrokdamisoli]BBH19977.1 hypothetical protein Back11_13220 [Paenibacillus baekrokdamisoli]
MDFIVNYLSFFVIQADGSDNAAKTFKHFQTLDREEYAESELKSFLDGEFQRICKRKAERHASSENAPTKIGRFIAEPGYELDSNPNYNLFQRLRTSESKEQYHGFADEMVRLYMDAAAVRGGALIIVSATPNKVTDEALLFVLKCDFEPKIARIADERQLISHVEMAISARNMKSIQYPLMPEEGMIEPWELKIHQASHARYFEDFLRFVSYEKAMPELMSEQMLEMVHEYMEDKWQGQEGEGRQQEAQKYEVWAASEKRGLQEEWTHEQVVTAAERLIEHQPNLSVSFKLDAVSVKGPLTDFGQAIHFATYNGRYIALIEGDAFQFDRSMSPVELLQPPDLLEVLELVGRKRIPEKEAETAVAHVAADSDDIPY